MLRKSFNGAGRSFAAAFGERPCGGLADIIELRILGIDLGQDVHLDMADRASNPPFQIVKFFLRAGVLAHEQYSRQVGYGPQGQVPYCFGIYLFQHGLPLQSSASSPGLDTVSRIYPTYGTLRNAELGQARVQVQSILLTRAPCKDDGPAGHKGVYARLRGLRA